MHIPAKDMTGHPVTQLYKPSPPAPSLSATPSTTITTAPKGKLSTLTMTVEFVCSASDLYHSLISDDRAKVWSRDGTARVGGGVEGGQVVLFGGNVTGRILSLSPTLKIVQTWRLKEWPTGHYSTVTISLAEQRESVKLTLEQTDVPVGELDKTKRNWEAYYWNGIKSAFGYGAVGF